MDSCGAFGSTASIVTVGCAWAKSVLVISGIDLIVRTGYSMPYSFIGFD